MTAEQRTDKVFEDYNQGLYVGDYSGMNIKKLVAFAIKEAVVAEREACATLAAFMGSEEYTVESGGGHGAPADGAEIAAAIRCRGLKDAADYIRASGKRYRTAADGPAPGSAAEWTPEDILRQEG